MTFFLVEVDSYPLAASTACQVAIGGCTFPPQELLLPRSMVGKGLNWRLWTSLTDDSKHLRGGVEVSVQPTYPPESNRDQGVS